MASLADVYFAAKAALSPRLSFRRANATADVVDRQADHDPAPFRHLSFRHAHSTDDQIEPDAAITASPPESLPLEPSAVAAIPPDLEASARAELTARLLAVLDDSRVRGKERSAVMLALRSPGMSPVAVAEFVDEHVRSPLPFTRLPIPSIESDAPSSVRH